MKRKLILVITGEISGDMHAASLVRAIHRKNNEIDFFGVGGDELRKAGMEIVYDIRSMAVLGFTEVVLKFRFFLRVFNHLLQLARERKPDAILLVDYPGFNLRFAAKARALGFKVIYYICPQVWAWNRSRIPKMARAVDRLITIFPFEVEIFRDTGLRVDFVGHPLVTAARAVLAEETTGISWKGEPRVAVLPGSRYHEVKRILPVMWSAAALLEKEFPNADFVVAAPSEEVASWVRNVSAGLAGGPSRWSVTEGRTRQVLKEARVAMVSSGTATLEAALMKCPMVVVYKVALATYLLGRLLIKVPYLGMVNIVANRCICPEFIQGTAVPSNLAKALVPLIKEGTQRTAVLNGLEEVVKGLGEPGCEEKAADILMEELGTAGSRQGGQEL